MGGVCSLQGSHGKCIKIVVGKPEGKRLLGKFTHRYENTIKIDLRESDCIHLARDMEWR
jgi:hypothetical protein